MKYNAGGCVLEENGNKAEILEYVDGEDWKEVGKLLEARSSLAATKIDANMIGTCN